MTNVAKGKPVRDLIVEYRRLDKEVDGEYPYTGRFIVDDHAPIDFIGWPFRKMVGQMSELVQEYDHLTGVSLRRVDRPGILPMGLGPVMVGLLRTDPLSALRHLMYDGGNAQRGPQDLHGLAANRFGPLVYLRVRAGEIECPLTGDRRTLAHGEKHGWKIRGLGTDHTKWLKLTSMIDDSPEGTEGLSRLGFVHWATVSVMDLLEYEQEKYFLPRAWNKDGPWIGHEQLEQMLEDHSEEGEEA